MTSPQRKKDASEKSRIEMEARDRKWALIEKLAKDGLTSSAIAERTGYRPDSINKIRKRMGQIHLVEFGSKLPNGMP
jgi:hypothetical protein